MKTLKPLLVKLTLLGSLLMTADAAMAGRWDDNRGWRGQDRFDRYDRFDRQWDRGRNYDRGGFYDRGRFYDRGNVRWSVNLNVGAPTYWGYQQPQRWRSSPYGWRTFYNPAPVVIQQAPRVIIQQAPPVVMQQDNYAAPSSSPSLLRDRYGRCYERSFNTLGTELRTELPASACNF